jgi:signal transduction histidine kinase
MADQQPSGCHRWSRASAAHRRNWGRAWWGPEGPEAAHPLLGLHRKRRFIFLLFGILLAFALIGLAGLAGLIFLIARLLTGSSQAAGSIWAATCLLALALPLLTFGAARWAFRSIGTPLANVMAAADAVADGDLSVSVPEHYPGEFGRLARSFNRMTRELARADEQRRSLTADVAHELRTPLHILQGNLEGLLDGVYHPSPEHIGEMLDETRRLARLVDDLQTISLAEAGQLPLHRESVDVAELIADVQTTFSGQAEARGLDLRLELADRAGGLPALTIEADAGRLEQVLGNLVANALRHTPAGGTITLRADPDPDGVRIMVGDTGEGIPAENLPHIFDRFWSGDPARTHADGTGSGLGLAIARQLVQAHGGQIGVDSQPGQGTVFTIRLPRR